MEEKQRTIKQNKSLHLWFRLLADTLNEAGLDMRTVLKPSISIEWNDKTIKKYINKTTRPGLGNHQITSRRKVWCRSSANSITRANRIIH